MNRIDDCVFQRLSYTKRGLKFIITNENLLYEKDPNGILTLRALSTRAMFLENLNFIVSYSSITSCYYCSLNSVNVNSKLDKPSTLDYVFGAWNESELKGFFNLFSFIVFYRNKLTHQVFISDDVYLNYMKSCIGKLREYSCDGSVEFNRFFKSLHTLGTSVNGFLDTCCKDNTFKLTEGFDSKTGVRLPNSLKDSSVFIC